MKQKLLLIAGLIAPTALSFAQTSPTVVTNKGDKISVSDLKIEPWNISNTTSQATSNTQSIYQNGALGIGDFSSTNLSSFGPSLNITRSTGDALINLTSGAVTNYINFFQNNAKGNNSASTVLGYLSTASPNLFTINNKKNNDATAPDFNGGVITLISQRVGIQTSTPSTDVEIAGQTLVRKTLSVGYATANSIAARNDAWINVGTIAGEKKPVARFSINNCGKYCGQGTARNIVFNNTNNTNAEYASLAFFAKGGNLTQADYDSDPAVEIAGIDRDAEYNYGGLAFRTNSTNGFATRLNIRSSGRIEILNVGDAPDNSLTKILAVDNAGQVGYIDKSSLTTTGTSNVTTNTGQTVVTVATNSNSTLQPVAINYDQNAATQAIANAASNTSAADGSADKALQSALSSVEPWNVITSTSKATINNQDIYQNGKVAIGDFTTADATAKLEVKPTTNEETIRLQDVKETSATTASFNGATGNYYDVKISEEGYIRKFKPSDAELNQSILYDLTTNYTAQRRDQKANEIQTTGSLNKMNWKYSNPDGTTTTTEDITLPADGAYVFSFRLYGKLTTTNASVAPLKDNSMVAYYIYAMKNNTTFDLAELNILNSGNKYENSFGQATYSVNLTVSGKKGDKVSFILTEWFYSAGTIEWNLTGNPGKVANKTSMFFWKL